MAPKLDTYEQAIYLYIFRYTRLVGKYDEVIALKSARSRIALGIGQLGRPMSESSASEKLFSLSAKGCVAIIATEHKGRRVKLFLPNEIVGVIQQAVPVSEMDIEDIDFFSDPSHRLAIFQREESRCFYTLQKITNSNFVIDHVISRSECNNSFKNLVAASREANNRKGSLSAEEFLRVLFRDGFLSEIEFRERLMALENLRNGKLRPIILK